MQPTVKAQIRTSQHTGFARAGIVVGAAIILAPIFRVRAEHVEAFGTYWASGNAVSRGLNPYAVFPVTSHSLVMSQGTSRTVQDINLNPPCVLPLFQMLSHLSLHSFAVVCTIASAAVFFASILLIERNYPNLQRRQLLWLCLGSAVFDIVISGQIYFLLLLLSTLGIICLERNQMGRASIAIGLLVAIKPTFIFWPLFAAASGRVRLAIRSLAVTAVVYLAALFLYGASVYRAWLDALANDNHWVFPADIALPAYFMRFGMPRIGIAVDLTIAAAMAVAIWKLRPSITLTTGIALCAAILLSPLGWAAYAIAVAPAFVAYKWNALGNTAAILLSINGLALTLIFSNAPITISVAGIDYSLGLWLVCAYFVVRMLKSRSRPGSRECFAPAAIAAATPR
jgi:hypothetical protein